MKGVVNNLKQSTGHSHERWLVGAMLMLTNERRGVVAGRQICGGVTAWQSDSSQSWWGLMVSQSLSDSDNTQTCSTSHRTPTPPASTSQTLNLSTTTNTAINNININIRSITLRLHMWVRDGERKREEEQRIWTQPTTICEAVFLTCPVTQNSPRLKRWSLQLLTSTTWSTYWSRKISSRRSSDRGCLWREAGNTKRNRALEIKRRSLPVVTMELSRFLHKQRLEINWIFYFQM